MSENKYIDRALKNGRAYDLFEALARAKNEEEVKILSEAICFAKGRNANLYRDWFACKLNAMKKEGKIDKKTCTGLIDDLSVTVRETGDALGMVWFARDVDGADAEFFREAVENCGDEEMIDIFNKEHPISEK